MAQIQSKFIAANAVTNAKLAQMPTLTIKGNNTGGTADASDLTVAQVNAILPIFTDTLNGLVPASGGGTSNFLRADGTFAAPSGTALTIGALDGQSPSADGAVILSSVFYQQSASASFPGLMNLVSQSFAGLKTFTDGLDAGSNVIANVSTPLVATDAANKSYVDAAINGLTWKNPAQAISFSDVPLTGATPLVIDGYTVQDQDIIVLAGQSTASENDEYSVAIALGLYTLTSTGNINAIGDAFLVLNGTLYANSAFLATDIAPSAVFVEFAGPQALSYSAPLSISGNTVSISLATTSTNGYLSSTDWNTFNNKQAAGNYITALTGDATASGPGSAALTLATVNSNVGSFGSSTAIPSFTVNAKGLITAASTNAVVAPAGTLTGTTLASNVVSSSLTSVGTLTSGTWNATTIAIANGGTGQTTASAAFDALSPMTTAGDIIYENSTPSATRLGIGSAGQVLTVVAGLPAWQTSAASPITTQQNITLSPTDITNQYVDLAQAIQGSSASANSASLSVVGGPQQLKTVDYTIALTGGVASVTRITFAGDLATGGPAELVSGDILMVSYTY